MKPNGSKFGDFGHVIIMMTAKDEGCGTLASKEDQSHGNLRPARSRRSPATVYIAGTVPI